MEPAQQEELITGLRNKIQVIMSLYEKAKDDLSQLEQRNDELQRTIEGKDVEYKKLSDKYEVLMLAKSVAGAGENTHDAKIKINRIVREIDKCIALMNR